MRDVAKWGWIRGPMMVLPVALMLGCGGGGEVAEEPEAAAEPAPAGPTVVSDVGFVTPESVRYDAADDMYLVSNINGSPLEADDNGFISRVSPDGAVADLKWIDGASDDVTLNAPKGMAIAGDTLYVADLTVIRMFDRATGEPRGEVAVDGSTFLNDVASAADGSVYFTDTGMQAGPEGFAPSGTDAVYRLNEGAVEKLAEGDDLLRPNGVAIRNGEVWVVTFGGNQLYRVAGGAKSSEFELPTGALDGLEFLPDGSALVSSWEAQAVYRQGTDGMMTTVVSDVQSPADIGYDSQRSRVLIPLMELNALHIEQVE